MRANFARQRCHAKLACAAAATTSIRSYRQRPGEPLMGLGHEERTARMHEEYYLDGQGVEYAPRAVGDFKLESPNQEIPGAHPLPLTNGNVEANLHPLVSPYMPSPHRVHPYFTAPLDELPHFNASVPIVYPQGTIKERIIAPVFDTATGTVAHTRELDPYVFGQYPQPVDLSWQMMYWVTRHQNYKTYWELADREIFRKAKKNWKNNGLGLKRVSDRKQHEFYWGGRPIETAAKPWHTFMPQCDPTKWHTACRQALTLKMLQGKLMVVDRLTLPSPTGAAFRELCDRMHWDVRNTGAGVLFMDGGSRLTPAMEFERSFFYGSFINGRIKVVRPTIRVYDPFDWNLKGEYRDTYFGPKGQKNPVPVNRFNIYDALDHHLLVVTEGALQQIEQEMFAIKVEQLPPHIRNEMVEQGMLGHHLLGDVAAPLEPVEMEAAGRTEEREKAMYAPYYDNPYRPWQDEAKASYSVDARTGYVTRSVASAAEGEVVQPKSWRKIQ